MRCDCGLDDAVGEYTCRFCGKTEHIPYCVLCDDSQISQHESWGIRRCGPPTPEVDRLPCPNCDGGKKSAQHGGIPGGCSCCSWTGKVNRNELPGDPPPGAFLICSSAWSGSTLLCYLLGAHSRIFGAGGVVHWAAHAALDLPEEDLEDYFKIDPCGYRRRTSVFPEHYCCGERVCHVWSKIKLPRISDVPQTVCQATGTDWLADTSKSWHWYEQLIERGGRFILILLHKPIWGFAASGARYGKPPVDHVDKLPLDRLDYLAWEYIRYYQGFRALVERHPGVPLINIRYEDLGRDPLTAISPLMDQAQLQVEEGQLDWASMKQHQVGGNGYVNMAKGKRDSQISLDKKVDEASQATRQHLLSQPGAQDIHEWLGR